MPKQKIYFPAHEYVYRKNLPKAFIRTGEYRPPQRGEWYLSGALPEAYLSPSNLDYPMHILVGIPGRMIECPRCEGYGKVFSRENK